MERIMINTCLQGYRKKDVLRDSKPVETVPDTEDDSYLNEAAERVPIDVLQRFIGDLPQGYRTVFNLYVFEGLSHKEIAQQLGIRERTSSSQFYRAKCLLVRLIKEYERKQR
jgi:RNA polymerase sigma-70 factor (ECF subfamily)